MLQALAFVVLALFAVGWVGALVGIARILRTHRWPRATATAIEIRQRTRVKDDGNRETLRAPVLRFTTHDGREICEPLDDWSTNSPVRLGRSAVIRYHPVNPLDFRLSGFRGSGLGLCLLALTAIPAGSYFMIRIFW